MGYLTCSKSTPSKNDDMAQSIIGFRKFYDYDMASEFNGTKNWKFFFLSTRK